MTRFPIFLGLVLAGAFAHAQIAKSAPPRLAELRNVIQQAAHAGQDATRKLSVDERALLRRQVQQQSRPHGK